MSNGIDISIENLKTELRNISLKISECRKAGLDTKIAELKVMNIPYKIQFAEVTKGYKDIEKVNSMLEDVKNEIMSIEKSTAKNAISSNKNGLKEINILISKINKALNENKLKEAKDYYLETVNVYNKLKNSDKKTVFGKLNELRSKLKKEF